MFVDEVEDLVHRVAIGCAIVLLFGPLGGRTRWEEIRGSSAATDAAGYNAIAVLSGVVALAALGLALWAREQERPVLPLLGTAVAVVSFGLTVYAAGLYVVARLQGGVWIYACWCFERPSSGWTVSWAPGPPFFALAALVGTAASITLGVTWLRQPTNAVSSVPAG